MTTSAHNETLDDIADEAATDTFTNFRDSLKLVLGEVTRLRTKVANDTVDPDDATALLTHVASLLKPGTKVLAAHQPLELASLSGGALALSAGASKYSPAVNALGDAIKAELHERPAELKALTTKIGAVMHGNANDDEIVALRQQLKDAQKSAKDLKDENEKLARTVNQPTGVSQIDHNKVKQDLAAAQKQITDLENTSTLAKIRGKFAPSFWKGKDVVVLDISKLKLEDSDLDALGIEKKK